MENINIIKSPVITEKSLNDAKIGVFTFAVSKETDKQEIRKAIESMFKVHVKDITTVLRKGKKKHAGKKRTAVMEPDVKIARVKLGKEEKIDLFEVSEGK